MKISAAAKSNTWRHYSLAHPSKHQVIMPPPRPLCSPRFWWLKTMRYCARAQQKSSPTPVYPGRSGECRRSVCDIGKPLGHCATFRGHPNARSMDGFDLARTVHDRWPAIKIILGSGRAELSEHERLVISRFYQKPFAIKQILEGLQEMISSR